MRTGIVVYAAESSSLYLLCRVVYGISVGDRAIKVGTAGVVDLSWKACS